QVGRTALWTVEYAGGSYGNDTVRLRGDSGKYLQVLPCVPCGRWINGIVRAVNGADDEVEWHDRRRLAHRLGRRHCLPRTPRLIPPPRAIPPPIYLLWRSLHLTALQKLLRPSTMRQFFSGVGFVLSHRARPSIRREDLVPPADRQSTADVQPRRCGAIPHVR